jgi:hypothetical protein
VFGSKVVRVPHKTVRPPTCIRLDEATRGLPRCFTLLEFMTLLEPRALGEGERSRGHLPMLPSDKRGCLFNGLKVPQPTHPASCHSSQISEKLPSANQSNGECSWLFTAPPWDPLGRLGELLSVPPLSRRAKDTVISTCIRSRIHSRRLNIYRWQGARGELSFPSRERKGIFRTLPLMRPGISNPSLPEGLEFYGIQLHHLTPGSIVHISGLLLFARCS